MNAADIKPHNAFAYSDYFSIVRTDESEMCVGCEHNKEEAVILANWLNNRNGGGGYTIRLNSHDVVRAARALRPEVFRHPLREEAFETKVNQ